MTTVVLEVNGLTAGYGGEPVVEGCDLHVDEGQVVLLMGRNGVGKTTLVSAISGRLPVRRGTIQFSGRRIERLAAHRRARLGISHVPQGREVIPGLTVRDNLLLASGSTRLPADADTVFTSFPVLKERLTQQAGSLSGGEQQMLAIGRALVRRPKLLILDEPSMGLAPRIIGDLFTRIQELVRSLGLNVLLVEQQVSMIWERGLVDHVYVLDRKRIALEGAPGALDIHDIRRAYLGSHE